MPLANVTRVHLAPPLLARRDPITGLPRKRPYGPWMLRALRVLRRLRHLRGTPLDPFGYTRERRLERALVAEFESVLARVAAEVDAGNYATAVAIAAAPQEIRGFGHVKARTVEPTRARIAALLEQLKQPAPAMAAD